MHCSYWRIKPEFTFGKNSAGKNTLIPTSMHYLNEGFMPKLYMVNDQMSVASSIILETGFPAPCPALVSILINAGLLHD